MATPGKRTKILCTLGPATDTKGMLRKMIKAGMDLVRINMSHGDHAEHSARIRRLKQAANEAGRPIGVLVDLQGPKLRIGDLPPDGVKLKKGDIVQLGGRKTADETLRIPLPFRRLGRELRRNDTILLADGTIELRTMKIDGNAVITRVTSGGRITSRKGINIPGRALSIPAFRAKDKADLEFALKHDADFIAMSFVRSAGDIRAVQRAMKRAGERLPVIAKVEKPQALDDIDDIIDAADGIMVARGDLGVELSVEQVPAAQKRIIQKCADARTWVIVATQMLESMIDQATPTRAEASDVANAVYDGADCVMLSGETAIGRHPEKAVKTMSRICRAAEAAPRTGTVHRLQVAAAAPGKKAAADRHDISRAVVDAALVLLDESEATALWVFTESGRTARLVSKLRPRKPVYGFSPHQATLRYLSGMWGIHPLQVAQVKSTDEMVAAGEEAACRHRCGRPGDRVVVLAGQAPTVGATDLIKIHAIR